MIDARESVSVARAEIGSIVRSYQNNPKFKSLVDNLVSDSGAFISDGYLFIESFKSVLKLNCKTGESDVLWLMFISVPDEYQKQGHATKMIKHLIALAKFFGFDSISLTVQSHGPLTNTQLARFYKKLGFKKIPKNKNGYELKLI